MSTRKRTPQSRLAWLLLFAAVSLAVLPSTASAAGKYSGSGGYDAPFFQADFYQDLTDWSSALVNPALTYRLNQVHFDAGAYLWANDGGRSWGFWQLAGFVPVRRNLTFGISLIQGISPDVRVQVIDPATMTIEDPGANPSYLPYHDTWIIATGGLRILPWLMAGINVKERLQNQFGELKAGTPGADLGIYLNPLDHYRFGDLGLSVNFEDILPSQTVWGDTVYQTVWGDTVYSVKNAVTTRLRVGLRYSLLNDKVVVGLEGVVDNWLSDAYQGIMQFAQVTTTTDSATGLTTRTVIVSTEGAGALKKAFRMGGAIKWQFIPQVWLKGGWNNNNIPYLGVNINLMAPLPEVINFASVDVNVGYSFIEYIYGQQKDERGITLMGKFSADVGPTREQRLSKRLYDQLILAPMDAYNEAMRLYVAKKYWLASFAFGKVITLFPNFHLNDKATYYMGDCYRKLYTNDVARETYQEGLEKYTTSDVRPKYLYGLMALDYREEKYDDALKNHAFIVNLYPESEIRGEADYIAAQVHFLRKNYHAAEQLLQGIKRGDACYLFAQYTQAIIHVENKKDEAAIACLSTIVKDTTQDPAQGMLLDGANLKLGHIYFEAVELRKAVEAYKRVAQNSPFADEALLGMAWSWIKVGQSAVAMQVLDQLTANFPQSPYIPESYLLKGYANMLLKRYSPAKEMLERCVELCKGDFITDEDLGQRKQQFQGVVTAFKPTGDNIRKNAMRRPTDRSVLERDALRVEFDKFSRENDDFFKYVLLGQSHKKFLRQKEQIQLDAEYALAKVVSMMGTQKQDQQLQKDQQKIQNIDQEIEKIKKDMEQGK